jgi:phage gp46-like protein
MSSGLELVTEGLFEDSGLSLTTHGLIVLGESGQVTPGGPLDATLDALLFFDPDTFSGDIRIKDGDLERETNFRTALLLSLFTDRRATAEELARFGGDDPRGWWGNEVAPVAGDEIGSKLWLLAREKVLPETLNRARIYARDALRWLIDDGVAARVDIEAAWLDEIDPRAPRGFLALGLDIVKPPDVSARFALVWAGVGV